MLVLIVYPLVNGFVLSTMDTNLVNRWEFVGGKYFVETLTQRAFWQRIGTTFLYAGAVVAGNLVVGTSLALLLNKAFRGRTVVRAILILPWLFPEVVVALVWKWIFNPLYGPLNHVLAIVGYSGEPIQWLETPSGALAGVIFASIWKGYPLVMIMVLAGLQSIPKERYEAAELDGAGKVASFIHMTLPGLRPVLLIVVILETVWYFKQFTIPWVMTAGGPMNATRLISIDIYRAAFESFQFGRAAAIAVLVFVIVLAITVVYRKAISDDDDA
ncbi:carbohydrate ABC transporter permease [Cellulomonas sp. KRMCY2]|uniref:carbohydrate ABC transporter permease n=1 Tax=Cellulomonas sp. KRMCY2 TaxID=1304865 RepID=UPI0004B8140F|nr:sugar ABC transporter permease [Cellulomonas sp. KRMCY2]